MADTFRDAVEAGAQGGPKFSQEGLDLVRTFEGFRPDAYYDLGGNKGTLTVGYGFTNADIPDLKSGYRIDQRRAEQMLPDLLNRKYGQAVLKNVKVPLTDQQYSALTSFVYNVGPGNFQKSTLLKKINAGDFDGASTEFDRWIYAGGKPMEGLVRRRAAEKELFKGNIQGVGALLEQQRFNLTKAPSLSQLKQGGQEDFVAIMEKMARKGSKNPEMLLPSVETPEGKKVRENEPLTVNLPAFPVDPNEDKLPKEQLYQNMTAAEQVASSDRWQGFEERLKKLTENLPEPPPAEGPKPDTQIAQADPFSNLPPPTPEGENKTSTVNAVRKMMGKEPLDFSNAGSNVKVDFKFGVGDVLAGLGKNIKDSLVNSFAQGGAWSPMPDSPEGEEEEPGYEPPEMIVPSFGGTGFTQATQQLNQYAGLTPARRG